MEWHKPLLTCAIAATLALMVGVSAALLRSWFLAGACALLAGVLVAHLSNFRVYWRWVIQLTDLGIDEIGTLARPDHRLSFAWGDITSWEREQLSGRGKRKLNGRHVYRYSLGVSPTRITWQSNYFPQNEELVAAIVARLGEPLEPEAQVRAASGRGPRRTRK